MSDDKQRIDAIDLAHAVTCGGICAQESGPTDPDEDQYLLADLDEYRASPEHWDTIRKAWLDGYNAEAQAPERERRHVHS